MLLLLPARSQARFRVVCKAWLDLLTSKPFLRLTAELAFSRDHAICAVSYSEEEYASAGEVKNWRFKQHMLSLERVPSNFRDWELINCHGGVVLLSYKQAPYKFLTCAVNPANQTHMVLRQNQFCCWWPVSAFYVEANGEGEVRFRVYADGLYDDDMSVYPDKYGAVYHSEKDSWSTY